MIITGTSSIRALQCGSCGLPHLRSASALVLLGFIQSSLITTAVLARAGPSSGSWLWSVLSTAISTRITFWTSFQSALTFVWRWIWTCWGWLTWLTFCCSFMTFSSSLFTFSWTGCKSSHSPKFCWSSSSSGTFQRARSISLAGCLVKVVSCLLFLLICCSPRRLTSALSSCACIASALRCKDPASDRNPWLSPDSNFWAYF